MTTVYKTQTKNNKSALVNRLKDYFEVEFKGILKGRATLTKIGEYKTANYQDAKKMADKYMAESKNTPYVKPFNDSGGNHVGWKASNKHGKLKFFGKKFEASAKKHAGLDEETLNEMTPNPPRKASENWYHVSHMVVDGNGKANWTSIQVHKNDVEKHMANLHKKIEEHLKKKALKEETLEEKAWFDKRSGDKTGSDHVDKHKKIFRKNLRKNRKRVKEALGMNEGNKPTFSLFLNEISKKTIRTYFKKKEEQGGKDYPNPLSFRKAIESHGIAKAKLGKKYKRKPLPTVKIKATGK